MIPRRELAARLPQFLRAASLTSPLQRPQLALLQPAQPRFKSGKKKKGDSKPSGNAATVAKSKAQERVEHRKALLKKVEKERQKARTTVITPITTDIPTASRYLKAAEVGRGEKTNAVSLMIKLALPLHSQPIRGSVRLPKPTKTEKIAVFTEAPEIAEQALKAGATYVGGSELVAQVKSGAIVFDKAYATPGANSLLRPIMRILGPKGLMPSERRGTMTSNVVAVLRETHGAIDFRSHDKTVTAVVAKASFTEDELMNNVTEFMKEFRRSISNTSASKAPLIKEIILSSTFGPGVRIIA